MRTTLLACALSLASLAAASSGFAQAPRDESAYPSRTIRVICAFPPGAGADFTARTIGQKLSEALGQPVVNDNKPGANGILAADIVAKSPPDGYTLLLIDRGALGINPSLYRNLAYDPLKDFAYIGIATEAAYVMVINPELPAKTFQEFVQLAKSKPGQINYGSIGIGSMFQLNVERVKARMGINLTHVAYKGAAPAVTAVVQGESGLTIASSAGVLSFINAGKLRAIAVGADKRLPILPDVPTMAEVGGGADTLVPTYFAFAAPAGTPPGIVMKLSAEIKRIVHLPDVVERLGNVGLDPVGGTPDEMMAEVKRDITRFGDQVKALGIQPE
jgi:tripartite-type tricarboxylate transporter receptor subunit TctC